jgi:hypothetical protein
VPSAAVLAAGIEGVTLAARASAASCEPAVRDASENPLACGGRSSDRQLTQIVGGSRK